MQDLLANDETTPTFVEGRSTRRTWTPTIYHRSHASVGGKIVKAYVQPGTYYSEADSEADDFAAPNRSQAYLAHVATPALIFIEADDPVIGLMCVISVGMAEVSSCVIGSKIRPGYRVRKGDELGYFQYGGSTHCLVFRPGAISEFSLAAIPAEPTEPSPPVVKVRSKIAVAN